MTRPRIFVVIASYRDPECQWTIRDLLRKARHPERIFVGLCNQLILPEDWHCNLLETNPEQVREQVLDAKSALGMCWARRVAHALWRGEEYVLQIDSHMRFHPAWDTGLLDMLGRCPGDKPVLSAYPSKYEPPMELKCQRIRMILSEQEPDGLPSFKAVLSKEELGAPVPSAFLAGGFMFAKAALFREVPYDPQIYMGGDEMSFTVRAWTSGWDPFSPHRCVLHHFYYRKGYPRHSRDVREWKQMEERGVARTRWLLGLRDGARGPALPVEPEFGLGSARSLSDYYRYAGITMSANASS